MLWYITNICSLHLTLSARSAWKSIETMLESLKWLQLSSNPMQVKSGCVERKKKKKVLFFMYSEPSWFFPLDCLSRGSKEGRHTRGSISQVLPPEVCSQCRGQHKGTGFSD